MAKKTIPKKIKNSILDYIEYLKNTGLKIKDVYLFGSYAKGNQKKNSDVDLCIISKDFNEKKDPLVFLWSKKRTVDTKAMISPIGFHPKNFINESPLVWEIKNSGIKII